MKLYDSMIVQLFDMVSEKNSKHFTYSELNTWPETKDFEILLQKDTAYEFGGNGNTTVNYTLVTTNKELFKCNESSFYDGSCQSNVCCGFENSENDEFESEVVVYGPDLGEINKSVSYARVSVVLIKEDEAIEADSEKLYHRVQDIDFVKYHIYPKGFMIRTSGQTNREQIRVSKEAIDKGISFERIGNTFIKHYLKNDSILCVKTFFITEDNANYSELERSAKQAVEIKKSLSKLSKGMPTECSTCGIKEICNEVEGLRELHFGKGRNRKTQIKI